MKDSILSFVSSYEKEFFETLKIDLAREKIFLGDKEFKLTDTIIELSVNNRVGSKWNGYQWTLQTPNKIDFSNVAELLGKDYALYRVHFGILEPSKALSLTIKGVEGTVSIPFANMKSYEEYKHLRRETVKVRYSTEKESARINGCLVNTDWAWTTNLAATLLSNPVKFSKLLGWVCASASKVVMSRFCS